MNPLSSTIARTKAALARGADRERREKFDEILENLRLAQAERGPFERRMAQFWREPLYITVADGTAISSSSTETILVPDFTVPAGYAYQGKTLKYTLFGESSFAATPGSLQMALRWGGVAGTVLAQSTAITPKASALNNRSWMVEYWMTFRGVGSSASAFAYGFWWLADIDDTSATTVAGNLNGFLIPASAPAAATIDTTTAKALSPTAKHSVTTGSTQAHMAILESVA